MKEKQMRHYSMGNKLVMGGARYGPQNLIFK